MNRQLENLCGFINKPTGIKVAMGTIAENVTCRRKDAGLSQTELADVSGVSQQLISQIERGVNLSTKYLPALARALRCSVSDLDEDFFGLETDPNLPARVEPSEIGPSGAALIPVYAVSASAGSGAMVADYEEVTHSLAFPPDYLRKLTSSATDSLAIINVVGESMQPTLRHDDIVMIDRSRKNLSYDGLFALMFDEMLHLKRISRSEQRGFVKIISDNPLHPPLEYPINDVTVVGRVLWRGGKM